MQTKKAVMLALIMSALFAVASIHVTHAGTAGAVSGVDTRTAPGGAGISTSIFPVDAAVYIYWSQVTPADGTVDVTVYAPDGSITAQWLNQSPEASGTLSFVVNQLGYYDISFDGQRGSVTHTVASVSILVTPEYTIGTAMAVIVGIGALGVFKLRKAKPCLVNRV